MQKTAGLSVNASSTGITGAMCMAVCEVGFSDIASNRAGSQRLHDADGEERTSDRGLTARACSACMRSLVQETHRWGLKWAEHAWHLRVYFDSGSFASGHVLTGAYLVF